MIIRAGVEDDHSFQEKVKHLTGDLNQREIRSCCHYGAVDDTLILFANPTIGIACLLLIVVFVLLFLGLIKGIMGLYCCPPVGMCGLGALIDLPRPLRVYQEEELADFPVKYDMIGWPVHPQTNKRTVRAISLRSEFCLNVIFFLTYPLIMIVTCCSSCCFAQVYDNDDFDTAFEQEQKIMLTRCPSILCRDGTNKDDMKCIKEKTLKTYNDESGAEDRDTEYVLQQMRTSEANLQFS